MIIRTDMNDGLGLANGQVVLWDTNLHSDAADSVNEAKESGAEGSDANASSGTIFIRPQMVKGLTSLDRILDFNDLSGVLL